jgi:hypothetical protein
MAPVKRSVVLLLTLLSLLVVASAAAAEVQFAGADGGARVRPGTLFLTGDGTLDVFQVQWNHWGGSFATGHGTAEYHGCTPICASAPVHHAAVTVRLSAIRRCGKRSFYTHVRLTLPSGKLLDPSFLRLSYKPCAK